MLLSARSLTRARPSRRAVLRGIGGAVLGLPALESLAVPPPVPEAHYIVFVRQGNGVAQRSAEMGEPEAYWPRQPGPLSGEVLRTSDSDRAVSELADYAERMLLVRGTRLPFRAVGCAHSAGANQLLTAAQYTSEGPGPSLALGESVDSYIARQFPHNGGEPLTLFTGPRESTAHEVLSYRGPSQLRAAEDDPWTAYLRLVGGPELDPLLSVRRRSVNDLVRDQMTALLGRTDLSASDRQRLELHFDSVRDFEAMACRLSAEEEAAMRDLAGLGRLDENREAVARLHSDLIALAFACDQIRAATLQVGDGADVTEYTVDGVRLQSYHSISHRVVIEDRMNTDIPIEGAFEQHHQIDRLHLRAFAHLLERMDAFGILDQSVVVHTNDLGTGSDHSLANIPWIIVGRGDGTLETGAFLDVRMTTHNLLLNTLINATGLRAADGGWVEDFGDPTLQRGLLSEMVA